LYLGEFCTLDAALAGLPGQIQEAEAEAEECRKMAEM
jgi:hypothetical protein